MSITEAPFSPEGNMVSYPTPLAHPAWRTEMRAVPPFNATLRVIGTERGQSAARFLLEDIDTGVTYPMFMTEMLAMLKDQVIVGTWGPCKRGANYGIRRVG